VATRNHFKNEGQTWPFGSKNVSLMKTIFNCLLLCCIALQLRAQTDTVIYVDPFDTAAFPVLYDTMPYPAPYDERFLENLADTCTYPIVTIAPVIHYQSGTVVYLEFSDFTTQIRIQLPGTAEYEALVVNGHSIVIQNLQPDAEYEVLTQNTCGNYRLAGKVDTRAGEKETLDVSSALYNAIRDHQLSADGEGGAIPFNIFIAQREDVAFFEKVYFIQQYYLHGVPIDIFSQTALPDYRPPTICNCKFVFNIQQLAVPGILNGGTIEPKVIAQPKQHMSGNDDTSEWWNRNTKGAAKWHQLWTEGSKAGSGEKWKEMKMADSTTVIGSAYGVLRYNLYCQNFEQVPADCECQKGLFLYWGYNSEACAWAERHSEGWGEKKAWSAAEDLAAVVLTRDGDNNLYVVDTGLIRARAECEKVVNSEFWANAARVALRVAGVVYGISAGDTLSPSQQQIFNFGLQGIEDAVTDLIETPYYSSNMCNFNNCIEMTMMGDTFVYLSPNKPISLYLYSNTSLLAGGKRSWFSWGRVLSNYYLAGFVPGGYASEGQEHCCTRKYGNWVLGSELGAPHTTEEVKNEVGLKLGAWAPWPSLPKDDFSGIVKIPYEYWSTSVRVEECGDGGALLPDDHQVARQGKERELFQASEKSSTEKYTILVFDISGRLLFQDKSVDLPDDLRAYFLSRSITGLTPGVYLIQAISKSDSRAFKMFIE